MAVLLFQKMSQQSNPEELQEVRREDLDKIFPERKNIALDLASDVDLYKMRRKIKYVNFCLACQLFFL